jgi:hypothetical protein
MNKHIAIFCAICLTSSSRAFGTGLSETNNGLFLAVSGEHSGINEPVRFSERLVWLPFCSTNTGRNYVELQYPSAKYGMKIKMVAPDGKEVPKTSLGETFGSKWEKLHDFKDSKLNGVLAYGPYQPDIGAGGGRPLPSPEDLFEMKQPGVYTLEIQMQMFRHTGSTDPNDQHRNLVRFSPIKIKVEKPPDAK